jgi:hypothetical protein
VQASNLCAAAVLAASRELEDEIEQQQQQQRAEQPPSPQEKKWRCKWPCELLAHGASARSVRFGVLLMVSLLPFGSHFVKNCFSSLQVYFLADRALHFSSVKYGSLMSAQSLPNVFMPFLGGLVLDSKVPVSYAIHHTLLRQQYTLAHSIHLHTVYTCTHVALFNVAVVGAVVV